MNCESYAEAIDDMVDGTIDAARRAALERHLAGCPSCRALTTELQEIRAAGARLPVHQPPPRIWERLSTRLPAQIPAVARETAPGWFGSLWTPRWRLVWAGGAALALVVVLVAVALPRLQPQGASRQAASRIQGQAGGTGVHAAGPDVVQSVESELRQAEVHYQNAIGGLEKMATAGEGALDPETASTLRRNLTVVDQAIAESRAALQSQPTSELAQESLFEAFRRKVGLLQDTVTLMNEMRKGNQAEAAKILGSMNK